MPPARPIEHALAALLPPPDADEAAWVATFRAMAALLLRRVVLVAGGVPHRLVEIEFYYYGGAHLDDYTHRDPLQQRIGCWYFHRAGTRYRGGSYKGLDISIGGATVPGEAPAYGGVLLRGLERLDGGRERVEGPSSTVDRILALTGDTNIESLVARVDLRVDETSASPLFLRPEQPVERAIYATPRVGLTLLRGDVAHRSRYLARPYRFLTDPERTRKGRAQLLVALHREGRSVEEIVRTTGAKWLQVRRAIELFEQGRRRRPEELRGELAPDDVCLLLGACHDRWEPTSGERRYQ